MDHESQKSRFRVIEDYTSYKIWGCVSLRWSGPGSLIPDSSDHSASRQPMNPLWERIYQFLWCIMILAILNHWSWSRSSERDLIPSQKITSWSFNTVYSSSVDALDSRAAFGFWQIINNYSSSPNGLWVNSPWGRRPNGLLIQSPCLANGTRARSARGSQNCAILSIICPFTGNSAFRLCVNDPVLGVPCRKDATEVFFCEVHTSKYIINTVLPSS